ncbi:MAG: polyphosphate kinase 2 family protein, partial [Variovorax sp.]
GDLTVREKWGDYQRAYQHALRATSSGHAPWHVIPADSKRNRNLMIARLLVKTLREMKLEARAADQALDGLVVP